LALPQSATVPTPAIIGLKKDLYEKDKLEVKQ
jgi:hypothetical protein